MHLATLSVYVSLALMFNLASGKGLPNANDCPSGCGICVGLSDIPFSPTSYRSRYQRYTEVEQCTHFEPIDEALETLIRQASLISTDPHNRLTLWAQKYKKNSISAGFHRIYIYRTFWLDDSKISNGMNLMRAFWELNCPGAFRKLYHDSVLGEISRRRSGNFAAILASGYIRNEVRKLLAGSSEILNSANLAESCDEKPTEMSSQPQTLYNMNYGGITGIVNGYVGLTNYSVKKKYTPESSVFRRYLGWISRLCICDDAAS
eukprot:926130_1